MSMAARLRDLRLRKRQSLQDVADAIGISKTHVWELEKSRAENPSLDILRRFADHFGVTIRWLVGEDMDKHHDDDLVRMFRQAEGLSDSDRAILDDMIQSLRKRRQAGGPEN